jgi:aminoglycoside 6-adenylyltransferase
MSEVIARSFAEIERRFSQWAGQEENIRAASVIGSRARQDHPADEWSDLDILIFARDAEIYRSDATWIEHMGKPWITFVEPTPDGHGFERRVLYDGGLDVDYALSSVDELHALLHEEMPPAIADMIYRGVRILVDKDGLLEQVAGMVVRRPSFDLPAEETFLNLVNDFWYHTVWTAKKLRRGELWWGKSCCDVYLKELLREMLVWHTRAVQGEKTDTWMRGRFLEEWIDPRAAKVLPDLFAHYDTEDVWRALRATMKLFRWLAEETAAALEYAYPEPADKAATDFVASLYQGAGFATDL